jgi:hypothetical protein
MGNRAPGDERIRALMQQAATHDDASVDRLVEAIPSLFAEARRRRAVAATPAAQLSTLGGVWVPRLAAATALLALTALIWPSQQAGNGLTEIDEIAALNGWIVNGSSSSSVSDPILNALVR